MPNPTARAEEPRSSLPLLTSLIGRDELLTALAASVTGSERLFTLTGPGGVGKTRLALALAERMQSLFTHRVWFVPLAALSEPARVPTEIARTLEVNLGTLTPLDALRRAIGIEPALLVLDNLEQLLATAPFLVDLLESLPALTVVTTSREALRVRGEVLVPIPPLSLSTVDVVEAGSAETLFIERVRAFRADYEPAETDRQAIRGICQRLDGLPLAIELAAARMRALPPAALAARLVERLDVGALGPRDLPARQRTLHATIAWSYDLLSEPERALFGLLSLFRGGANIVALEAIWAKWRADTGAQVLDLVESLAWKSLVEVQANTSRVSMLETIRHFATRRLAELDPHGHASNSHAEWFLQFAESTVPDLTGPKRSAQLAALDEELPNLRVAGESLVRDRDANRSLRFVEGMWRYWETRGLLREGADYADRALAFDLGPTPPAIVVNARYGAAVLPYRLGDFAAARVHADQCLALCERLADLVGKLRARNISGMIAFDQGDFARSESDYLIGLAHASELGNLARQGDLALNLGLLYLEQERYAEAEARFGESLRSAATTDGAFARAFALNGLGLSAHHQGRLDDARRYHEEAIAIRRHDGDSGMLSASLTNLAWVEFTAGELTTAQSLFQEALRTRWRSGEARGTLEALAGITALAFRTGDLHLHARCSGAIRREQDRGVRLPRPIEREHAARAELARDAAGGRRWRELESAGWSADLASIVDEALQFAPPHDAMAPSVTGPLARLTPREIEVLRELVRGKSDREISLLLGISRNTAVRHVANIFDKLETGSRTTAAMIALRHGLGEPVSSPPADH